MKVKPFHRTRASVVSMLLFVCSGAVSLYGAVPTLTSLFPAGGQKGTTFTLTTNGKTDAGTRCWINAPGVSIQPDEKPNQWKVNIAADAPAGLYLFRLFNQEGASSHRWFRVGTLPEISEVEPNDETGTGQLLEKLPVCINAKLEKSGDVDGYRIALKKGQTLSAHVEAYTLGSAVDVIAHVLNGKGTRVLTASDDRNLDPAFHFTAPEDDVYTVQLAGFAHPPQANVAYAGGADLVYRLQLTSGPVVTHVHPAAVSTKAKTEVTLQGLQLDPDPAKSKAGIEPAQLRQPLHESLAWLEVPYAFAPIQVVPATVNPIVEKEPNQEPPQATPIKPGDVIGGHIAEGNDLDRFAVEMKKGERLRAKVYAKALGSPLDATLQIFAPDGKNVAFVDDTGSDFDPVSTWTASVDGTYQVVLTDTLRQGGKHHFYTLVVAPPVPYCQVTLASPAPLTLAAGKTESVKATVKLLNGLNVPLVIRASNLPFGVHAEEVAVPEKGGEIEIKLVAASNAEPTQQPIQLSVWTKGEAPTVYPATAPLRGENLRGTSLLDHTTDLWLTVTR